MKKLVFSDIDGTLLDPNHQVTVAAKQVIGQLTAQEVKVVLASARSPKAMIDIATASGLTTPLVCFNGALITQAVGEKFVDLYSLTLERLDTLLLYQLLSKEFPTLSVNLYSQDRWLVAAIDPWVQQEADITGIQPEVVDLKLFLKDYHPIHKILCMGDPAEIQRLSLELEAADMLGIDFYPSKDTYMEIVNNQVSKLAALCHLCEAYNCSLAETIAIGDNYNDMPMIQHAGIGIAMGNSPEEVKQIADEIAPANSEEGFSRGLAKCFGLAYNE